MLQQSDILPDWQRFYSNTSYIDIDFGHDSDFRYFLSCWLLFFSVAKNCFIYNSCIKSQHGKPNVKKTIKTKKATKKYNTVIYCKTAQ